MEAAFTDVVFTGTTLSDMALQARFGLKRHFEPGRFRKVMFLGTCDLHVQITPRANPRFTSLFLPHRVTTRRTELLPDGAIKLSKTFRAKRTPFAMTDGPCRIRLDARDRALGHAQTAVITGIWIDGKNAKETIGLCKRTRGTGVLAAPTPNTGLGNYSKTHEHSFLDIDPR